jgi:hypothetical protein
MTAPDSRPIRAVAVPWRKPDNAHFLRLFVLTHPEVFCPRCGDDLRRLTGAQCPRCHLPLALSLGSAEPLIAPWVALLPPLLMPAGVGLLLAYFLVRLVDYGGRMPRGAFPVLATYSITCVALSAVVVLGRRAFMVLPRATQVGLAVSAWLSTLVVAYYVWRSL